MASTATSKTTTFNVGMSCNGCANAVKRILGKIDGVSEVQADVENKIVKVVSSLVVSEDDMLAALKKWGSASGKLVELVTP